MQTHGMGCVHSYFSHTNYYFLLCHHLLKKVCIRRCWAQLVRYDIFVYVIFNMITNESFIFFSRFLTLINLLQLDDISPFPSSKRATRQLSNITLIYYRYQLDIYVVFVCIIYISNKFVILYYISTILFF